MTKNNLKVYSWQGKNQQGETIAGEITAYNLTIAKVMLRNKNILILKVKVKPKLFFKLPKKIKSKTLTFFTRQLATMLSSGVPLLQTFDIIADSSTNTAMKRLIYNIKKEVEAGEAFSTALSHYPRQFNQMYCSLIRSGEQAGALDKILDKLAVYKEKTESLKAKIKKALIYPAVILLTALLITMVILIFVIPQFQTLFTSFGADLPWLTGKVITLSLFVSHYWWVIITGFIFSSLILPYVYRKYLPLRHLIEKFSLKLPLMGTLLMKAAVARFARTLVTTFSAGVPIFESLETVAAATGNIVFETAVKHARSEIAHGQSLYEALRTAGCFPALAMQMIKIGEETGKLDQMLSKIADYYEEEVDVAAESISTLIEPMIMLILSVIIGGLVIAMYLPIFKMGSIV